MFISEKSELHDTIFTLKIQVEKERKAHSDATEYLNKLKKNLKMLNSILTQSLCHIEEVVEVEVLVSMESPHMEKPSL